MQSILFAQISKTDLQKLFVIGPAILERWEALGCPRSSDGSFVLSKVCRWFKSYHEAKLKQKRMSALFTQKELAELMGISRQTIAQWRRAGLPRRKDKRYDLSHVLGWLLCHYQACAKREYESRLKTMRKKVARNAAQLQRFLAGSEAG